MKSRILTFSISLVTLVAMSQNCQENLLEAERFYFDGQFDKVVEKIANCSEGLSPAQKERRRALLAQTYLIKGEDSLARFEVEEILMENPLYVPEYGSIDQFNELVAQYDIIPKWSWSLSAGVYTPEFIIDQYHSYSSVLSLPAEYEASLGFQAKLDGTHYLMPWLPVRGSLSYRQFEYGYTDILLDAQAARFDERLQYLGFGLSSGLSWNVWGWKFEATGGILSEFLLSANADVSLIPTVDNIPVQGNPYPATASDVDSKGWRNPWNHNIVAQFGIHKDFDLSSIGVSAQFQQGLSNLTNSDERWSNSAFTYEYGYLPDDFTMNGWTFSVNYSRYVYHPKRKQP